MKKITCILAFSAIGLNAFAQTSTIDSLKLAIARGKEDTTVVMLYSRLATDYYYYSPDSAYYYANKGLLLSQKLHFAAGEADNLLTLAESQIQSGNYPRALEELIRGLKISEQINYQTEISYIKYELATLYYLEKDYNKALEYGFEVLLLAEKGQDELLKFQVMDILAASNEGTGKLDSALYYISRNSEYYIKIKDPQGTAFSETNIAEIYVKMKMDERALHYYRLAIPYITEKKINEALCETSINMAGIFQRRNEMDSAILYGKKSFDIAKSYGFTSRQLDACNFLSSFYESTHHVDSSFKYLKLTIALKDSMFNQEKQKEIANLTFDENTRQQDIAEQKKIQNERDSRNIQLTAIGVFIPIFFIIVLLLMRIKVKARVVEFLAIVGLLLFFEFITDLAFPYISNLTDDKPIWEMLILVLIAALIEPLNYRIERWVKLQLVRKPVSSPELGPDDRNLYDV